MIHTRIDPYEVLGVSTSAEPEAIAAAFKALALKYHPDRNPGGDGRMKALNEAFAILNDPAKRREYDRDRGPRTAKRPQWAPSPPRPEPRNTALSCAHHPGAPAVARCASCGRPVCAVCLDVRRRLGGGAVCSACRCGHLQARIGTFLGLLLAGAVLWKLAVHPNVLGAIVLAYPGAAAPTGLALWRRARTSRVGGILAAQPRSLGGLIAKAALQGFAIIVAGGVAAPVAVLSAALLLALELRAGRGTEGWWRRAALARWARIASQLARIRRVAWGTR